MRINFTKIKAEQEVMLKKEEEEKPEEEAKILVSEKIKGTKITKEIVG